LHILLQLPPSVLFTGGLSGGKSLGVKNTKNDIINNLMKKFIFILLVFLLPVTRAEAYESLPEYNLSVSFDISKNVINGDATILLKEDGEAHIAMGNLTVTSLKFNGSPVQHEIHNGILTIKGKGTLELAFESVFGEDGKTENPENAGVVSRNIISSRGISLTRMWYPSIEGMAFYHLKAFLPEGFHAVSEAESVEVSKSSQGSEYVFSFPHPVNGITFAAGKYREVKDRYNGIEIFGYFFPEDIHLAKTYLEHTGKYLKMYEELLAPYPYKRFSVVENFLSTGYSMPTFTLIGQDIVRLPFIVETSLGHEILHQWFGNSVYVDSKKGNWSEGLTSYLSDHLYEEQKGNGWEYRKNILSDYESYVHKDNEFALVDFVSRMDFASKSIGYGKGAMVFHMLKKLIGEEAFYRGLREFLKEKQFREASWDDLRDIFEKTSGKSLGSFFSQWVTRKDIPSIRIKSPKALVLNGIQTVSFQVIQKGEPFSLQLPVLIHTDKGDVNQVLSLEKHQQTFDIPVEGTPLEMAIDRDYDIMRRLSPEESPAVISRLLGDEKRIIVMPGKDSEKYSALREVFQGRGFTAMDENDIKDEDIRSSSLLVLGIDGPVLKRLFGGFGKQGKGFSLDVRENPLNPAKVVAVVSADSTQEVDMAVRKIFHYGKYSSLRFENGRNVEKQTRTMDRGIEINLQIPVKGIQPQNTMDLDKIIQKVIDKPVIYLGERHGNYEDHKIQLKTIMYLHEKGRKFAIGMEMFEKPFQNMINDYLAGTIDEKHLLKETQYFKRWQFDYNFYREIIEYAKAEKIPVVALNQWSEIIKKVSTDGLDGLTDIERQQIPEDMDMSDDDYRRGLRGIFETHRNFETRNFEYFYQSQILWDETMAHTVNEFMKKNPDYQMVVMTGVGHVMYGSGIPKRAFRLNGKEYVTLLPTNGILDDHIGDFILFPEPLPPPSTIKLGIVLKELDGMVKIKDIIPGSRVEGSGLKKDDILVSLDDWKIEDIDDIKIVMFDKKQGDTVRIKVYRKKFLSGYQTMEFTAAL
jgi:aminopeptidase N